MIAHCLSCCMFAHVDPSGTVGACLQRWSHPVCDVPVVDVEPPAGTSISIVLALNGIFQQFSVISAFPSCLFDRLRDITVAAQDWAKLLIHVLIYEQGDEELLWLSGQCSSEFSSMSLLISSIRSNA